MKNIYTTVCVLGTLIPYAFFAQFRAPHGLDSPLFINHETRQHPIRWPFCF